MDIFEARKRAEHFCRNHGPCQLCEFNEPRTLICELRQETPEGFESLVQLLEKVEIPTRQTEFLKQFPHARVMDGVLHICPKDIETEFFCQSGCKDCGTCREEFWSQEV